MDLKDHLKRLTELHAPSGHEEPARAYVREVWSAWVDEFQVDGLGSLIGLKRGTGKEPRKRIMLSAHMDEIAMMVTEVREGYLRVMSMAGVDGRTLQAKSVIVHGRRQLIGTVAAVPPHISSRTGAGKTMYPKIDEQWIDLGLPAKEVEKLVREGDLVTMDAPMLELKGDLVAGKVMDDRASVAVVSYCLELLQRRHHVWDVYAVASTQEEKGLLGATTAAFAIKPDLGVALDVNFAKQPGVNEDGTPEVGKGVTISIGPNFHPGLVKSLKEVAKECEIPIIIDPLPGAVGTDSWVIQVAHQGVPTALLGVPIRNMHSTVETASLRDIKRAGRLLAEFISGLDEDYLTTIDWDHGDDDENHKEN